MPDSVESLFKVCEVVAIPLMLKMLLHQDVTVEDLLNCAFTWSEASLFFCLQFLCSGADAALCYMTLLGWLLKLMVL